MLYREGASNHILGGQIGKKSLTPSLGKYFSHPFLPATPSSLSQALKGLFDLMQHPPRALDSPLALLLDLQIYKDPVRSGAFRCGGLGTLIAPKFRETPAPLFLKDTIDYWNKKSADPARGYSLFQSVVTNPHHVATLCAKMRSLVKRVDRQR